MTLDRPAPRGHQADMLIYKIFRGPEWAQMQAEGQTLGAPIDRRDGYVHFSTAAQAAETARRHFAGEADLWLIAADAAAMGADLAWEPSRGGDLFPHLYRAFRMQDVRGAEPLPLIGGEHQFPLLPDA